LTYDFSMTFTGIASIVQQDEDDGIAATLRCDAEFEPNLSLGLSLEGLNRSTNGSKAVEADAACPSSEDAKVYSDIEEIMDNRQWIMVTTGALRF
jgi:hypothetical protein